MTAGAFAHYNVACVVVDDDAYADFWPQRFIGHFQGE
jgi:hypothetical protein